LAFIIQRLPDFRRFGSIIDAALELGHEVELWHDYSQPREGVKGSQFPHIDNIPVFIYGLPKSRTYEGKSSLAEILAERSIDCVVASRGPVWYLNEEDLNSHTIPWIGIQENIDYVLFGVDCITSATVQCLFSQYWIGLIPETYAQPGEEAVLKDNLKEISRFTGSTQADSFSLVDPKKTREYWNIPDDVPVVLYLPSPSGNNLFSQMFLQKSRLAKAKLIVAAGQWQKLPYLRHDVSDRSLVRAVRQFCDNNNAFMLVKTREKQPLPDYLEQAADRLVMDEVEYPATILQALSISDLCISAYLSASINDCAVAGVPFVGIYRDTKAWPYSHMRPDMIKKPGETFFLVGEGDYFNQPGFAYPMYVIDAIKKLGQHQISDYPLRREALDGFIAEYLGSADGKNGHRVIEEIQPIVAGSDTAEYDGAQGLSGKVHPGQKSASQCAWTN
jgi:hypothetical protein